MFQYNLYIHYYFHLNTFQIILFTSKTLFWVFWRHVGMLRRLGLAWFEEVGVGENKTPLKRSVWVCVCVCVWERERESGITSKHLTVNKLFFVPQADEIRVTIKDCTHYEIGLIFNSSVKLMFQFTLEISWYLNHSQSFERPPSQTRIFRSWNLSYFILQRINSLKNLKVFVFVKSSFL